jgi:hypothetical protein
VGVVPTSLLFAVPGVVIGVVGVIVTLDVWHVGGIVILMVGAALLLVAQFMRSGELRQRRQ